MEENCPLHKKEQLITPNMRPMHYLGTNKSSEAVLCHWIHLPSALACSE